jgi:hypothetical protein
MVYRQDGLIWQPCGYLSCRECDYYPGWPWTSGAPNTTGFFLWADGNGDGRMSANEFTTLPQLPSSNLRANYMWVGEDGSVTFRTGDVGGEVHRLAVEGISSVGCPAFSLTTLNLSAPAPQFEEQE